MPKMHSVSFSLVFLAVAAFAAQAHEVDLCAKSDSVPLCKSVVKGASDPKAALKSAIQQLILETERAREAGAELGQIESLGVCKKNFCDAISSLQESLQNLKTNDKHSLKTNLSAARTSYIKCDDAVGEGGIVQLASGGLTTHAMLRQLADIYVYLATLT